MSRIRADKLVNRAGTGAPELPFGLNAPNGLNVTGVVTATSFQGDGSALTGIDATTIQTGTTKVQTAATKAETIISGVGIATVTNSGINVSGIVTATTFEGNLTGTASNSTTLADAGNITTGILADSRFPSVLPAVSGANLTNIPTKSDIDTLTNNIAMLGFKVAVNGSLTKFNLVDQIIDEFTDASGVDSGASTNIGVSGSSSGKYYTSLQAGNYFGNESDGAFNSSGLTEITVQNTNGSYDGDMVIKQYSSFTLNAGHTYRPNQACRGMLIYCTGNMVINGTIDMTGKGAKANPTNTSSWNSAGSDGNTVGANGLQIGLLKSGSSETFTNDGSGFNGCGTAARNAVANQSPISGNGKVYTIARQGAAGGSGGSGVPDAGDPGSPGASSNQTGGGGGGATSNPPVSTAGNGSYGSCWSGGSGGSGVHNSSGPGMHAEAWGGAGGGGSFGGHAGGAGNPGGTGSGAHGSNGQTGTGGTLIIICGGTISGNGTLRSVGSNGGTFVQNTCGGGGGSGGGAILVLANQSTFTGTLTAAGGTGTVTGSGSGSADGGNGGAGYTLIESGITGAVVASSTGTLQSVDTTASSVPSKSDLVVLIENAAGTATLNTDIKGYVSRDSGTTFTQGTLEDEGTWGTNKKIVAFHDLDISGQPSGTSMCYKIELANQAQGSKETRIHAVSHGWA